jgi:hypothetical protein
MQQRAYLDRRFNAYSASALQQMPTQVLLPHWRTALRCAVLPQQLLHHKQQACTARMGIWSHLHEYTQAAYHA